MTEKMIQTGREVEELPLLYEISRSLARSIDLREVVGPVLKAIAQRMGMLRGTLTLLDRNTKEIFIEEAYGLSPRQQSRGRYRLGEGVTGEVFQTGEPAIVPRISRDPRFLDRTGARKKKEEGEFSFICVPIKLGSEVIGALSMDRLCGEFVSHEEDVRLLSIIAAMLAQAVRLRQSVYEERRRLMEENTRLREELRDRFRPDNILGNSREMQDVYDLIQRVSGSDTTVLISGESGTGKELVAHAIHYNSPRAGAPFVKVSCSALPESLIESELFGHEKGAFTGATAARQGRFELASGGTIFLDEIGDLSPAIQVKLLRVLQEREFERVGSTDTIKANVRVVAATNRDLLKLIEEGIFRPDLFYRLNVFPINIPPLRDRKTDIPLLADFFVDKYSGVNNKNIRRICTPAIDMLMSYHWPGNVRELENSIERAVIMSNDEVIHGYHLPPTLQTAEASGTGLHGSLDDTIGEVERELIIDALKSSRGNMARAARILGITERVMGLRVKKYRIQILRF
jgi:Nif-specific regulatory protein